MTRREFLSYSAMAGVVGAIGVSPILSACAGGKKKNAYEPLRAEGEYYVPDLPDKAVAGRELKAGVIGCGGRGSGAAENFLAAANGVTITALGDVFDDRLQGLKNTLKDKYQIEVADDKCFTGFDAYKNVIDSGVDVVIIATPPFFRPEHFHRKRGTQFPRKTDLRRSGRLPHRNGRGQAGPGQGAVRYHRNAASPSTPLRRIV